MQFSSDQIFQLNVVAVIGVLVFISAYSLPQRISATCLILLIPFQPIVTQYATANVVLTWVVFIAMLMRREEIRLPMLPQILLVIFVYLISMGIQHSSTYFQHGVYIFNLVTAYLVLCIAYDLALRLKSPEKILKVFIAMNVLVVIYCVIQMWRGPNNPYAFLGISELRMHFVLDDYRLKGPFASSGLIAEYLAMATFLLVHQILMTNMKSYRSFLLGLAIVNLILLLASGARGGLLAFVGAMFLFLWLFQNEIGLKRTLKLVGVGIVVITISAGAIVTFSNQVLIFDRLAGTEIESGIPDSRQKAWPNAWKEIKNRPILGHGPRIRFVDEEHDRDYLYHKLIQYPHNLYLSLLFAGGVVGLMAYMTFLLAPLRICWKTSKLYGLEPTDRAFAKIGVVVIVIFLVDQIKVEFLRISWTDYWHFLFALFGVLIAVCDMARMKVDERQNSVTI